MFITVIRCPSQAKETDEKRYSKHRTELLDHYIKGRHCEKLDRKGFESIQITTLAPIDLYDCIDCCDMFEFPRYFNPWCIYRFVKIETCIHVCPWRLHIWG